MNDSDREKLSAYLDGALSDAERRAVEVEISRSEEMRLELEALRAVSASVKGLPREKLPAGFMARLEARRAREGSGATREYFILPPSYRPLAFALSTAVIALVVWDKTRAPDEMIVPRVGWDNEIVSVKSAADAPPSIDVSGQVAALGGAAKGLDAGSAASVEPAEKKEDSAKPSTFGKNVSAPGKPIEVQENGPAAMAAGSDARRAAPAPSAERPIPDDVLTQEQSDVLDNLPDAWATDRAMIARNEEERSAINERLYKGFEEEKRRMGITKIMDKDAEDDRLADGGREFMALQATPAAPQVGRARGSTAAVRGMAKAKGGAPVVKALTLKSAEALSAAWAAAGLDGAPPAVNFPDQMAIFLAGPAGCGITGIYTGKKIIAIHYKTTGYDDPAARVRAVELSSKPVILKLAQ